MRTFSWNSQSYLIDGKPAFLVSGEFHYFRVPKGDWEKRLLLFKKAGGNCVATYIPWILHEPTEGRILFSDVPERDLEGFLTLCRTLGLFVIARPGPYQYSELRYDGLPVWLCDNYPDLRAKTMDGKDIRRSSISYLHPLFLEKTKHWFDAACPIIANHTIAKDGPVIMAQLDNELAGIHEWFGSLDYNREAMGIGISDGRYPAFLARTYATINALNAACGTAYDSFTQVLPSSKSDTRESLRIMTDYREFYFSAIAEYMATLSQWMQGYGIDCTFCHNSGNPGMNAYFRNARSPALRDFVLGSDHYYNLNLDWEQNNPTPKYAGGIFLSLEMLRAMNMPPTVFELPAGSLSDWPPITSGDLAACYMTNTAFGMKGCNYYIFTGGINPANAGATGTVYDYSAPISADGKIRPSYHMMKRYNGFLRKNAWLAQAHRAGDIAIGFDWDIARRRAIPDTTGMFGASAAYEFMQKGLFLSASAASFSPNYVDLHSDVLFALAHTPLFVSATDAMAASVQRRLVEFVKLGGALCIAPIIPTLDEHYRPCTILIDFLGSPETEKLTVQSPRVNVGPVETIFMNGGLFACVRRPLSAEAIAFEDTTHSEIGWEKAVGEKGGKVLFLGFHWKQGNREHEAMLRFIAKSLGRNFPLIHCDNPNILTSLRVKDKRAMLFVMNLFTSQQRVKIALQTLDRKGQLKRRTIFSASVPPMTVRAVRSPSL
ncbi:MAG: beta-galactosidase [Spirochaetota bacterium]